ncbi:phage head-tail joining protein [Azomonas macrocytogenes]|uniref:Uncharacterized protein n=1 Tax=Azomonas macrocytogenes TaxID=69962 RepID=A0A839T2M6_AZOMA|nr:hypothetical protein [Azomonas macrocytogenes]MBB3103791.1 hypothetical protein [Azomonas macrocytogenes]
MSSVQTQYQALKDAIYGGELTVRYNDRTITYRSIAEMKQILKMMEEDMAAANGTADTTGGRRYTSFSKGY